MERGWAIWCRETADNFRRAASHTTGRRSNHLNDLASHYETQADEPGHAMAGNKPFIRHDREQPASQERRSKRKMNGMASEKWIIKSENGVDLVEVAVKGSEKISMWYITGGKPHPNQLTQPAPRQYDTLEKALDAFDEAVARSRE